MSGILSKEELQKAKEFLIRQTQVSGILLHREAILGVPDEEALLTLLVVVEETPQVEPIRVLLDSWTEKPSIQFSVQAIGDLGQTESTALQKLFREGKLLYWNSTSDLSANQVFKIKLHTIFTFELKKLAQTAKARFNYQLYGRKGPGLLDKWEGKRLTKSCFFVPYKHKYKVIRFLNTHEISYKAIEMWI